MLLRRDLLAGAASAAAVAALPAVPLAKGTNGAAPSDPAQAARLNALMDEIMQAELRRTPETATALGIDNGELAWTKSLLSDASAASIADGKAANTDELKRLRGIDRSALSGMDAVNYDTVEFNLAATDEIDRKFAYGVPGGSSPYVVSQLTGAYRNAPDIMDNQHVIETKSDADAYLSRLVLIGREIDQETELVRHDAALGVVPPDFVIDRALGQMKSFLGQPVESVTLVDSLVRRARAKGVGGDWSGQASKLYIEMVRPALERQAAFMEGLRPKAVHDAGVWRLPDGLAYYAASARQFTTSSMGPDEVFDTGQQLVARLGAEADVLMKKQGLTQGTVGERFAAMFANPKLIYPNTDEGKEQLIADLNVKVRTVQAKLSQWFGVLPKASVEIHRVPKAIEAGAPGGYYNVPPVDGSRPGIYWINLRDTAEQPKWLLSTLTYHEAIPGHHLQEAIAKEAKDLPLLRKATANSGYVEGWALYAEQLAVEMGMYDNDPIGHIGQLHDAMLRAVRMVVDSGMHVRRWSREQAIKYYTDHLGDQESGAITEIERYCVWPGQACSYMIGKLTILAARDRAKKALGRRFDIRRFHDLVLLSGIVPLDVLSHRVDDWIAAGG
jgi:uncharacterized protein (DUF885 family)